MNTFMIGESELCELLGVNEVSFLVRQELKEQQPLIYRHLTEVEYGEVIDLIQAKLRNPNTKPSGKNFKENWAANWSENLVKFRESKLAQDLVPNFIPTNEVLRFQNKFIMPLVPDLEIRMVRILRTYLFEKYISDKDVVHEFGAGSGFNLVHLGQLYPSKRLYGYDWVDSSVELIRKAGESSQLPIIGEKFDMFNPNYDLSVQQNSALLTVGALEQLGCEWDSFFQFMIQKRFEIYIHIETIFEKHLSSTELLSNLARQYIVKRNWLQGYFQQLEELHNRGFLEILEQRVFLGSKFHDSWTFTVWKLKNV